MPMFLFQPLRYLWTIVRAHDSPLQVAGGFTLGAIIGWLPADNLIVLLLCLLLCSVRLSKPAGALGALIFVWIGAFADPLADAIGSRLLHIETLQGFYAWLYDLPLGAWIGYHNTVVLGSLVLAIYFSYPIFWLSYFMTANVQRHLAERARRRAVRRLVAGMKIGASWGVAA
jgi:uncharacterized protein (TIGR03546 family)